MSKSHRRSSSRSFSVKKKRTGFQTFVEMVMGLGAAIVLIGLAYFLIFARKTPEKISESENVNAAVKNSVVDSTAGFEAVRDGGNLDDMKELLAKLQKLPKDAEPAVQLGTLSQGLELAQKILDYPGLAETDRVVTASGVLSMLEQYYGVCFERGIFGDGSIVERYMDACNRYLDDADPSLAREARVAHTRLLAYELIRGSEEGSVDSVSSAVHQLIQNYTDDPSVLADIQGLIAKLTETNPQVGAKMVRDIVNQYDSVAVSDQRVLTRLRAMKDFILLEDSGIGQLGRDAKRTGDDGPVVEKLIELIRNPDTGISFVNMVYLRISEFEFLGKYDLAKRILGELGDSAPLRTDAIAKWHALRIARFGLIRNGIVGKKIDLSDTDNNGKPIDVSRFEGTPSILFFFSPNLPRISETINSLASIHALIGETNVQVIAISVENPNSDSLPPGLPASWTAISSDPRSPSQIFMRCPVSNVPYFVLIDQEGTVTAINIPENQLKTRVQQLISIGGSSGS